MKTLLAKLAYALGFTALLPALLVGWARALDAKFPGLPAVGGPQPGVALIVAGGLLMLGAMWNLWRRGGGLPMNAFPPPRLVGGGLYGWFAHPIYLGFALALAGAFLVLRAPAGIWIVSPALWLGMTALVIGHERIDLGRRFGPGRLRPRLAVPEDRAEPPGWWHRLAVFALVLGPWLIGYEGLAHFLRGAGTETYLPFERRWTPLPWSTALYAGAYLWVALAPLAATTQAALRRFVREGWVGAGFIFWCFLVFPFTASPRPLAGGSWLGALLAFDRAQDTTFCALPAFHVFWPLLAAGAWAQRMRSVAAYALAGLMAASSVTTGQHSLLDAAAGAAVFAGVAHLDAGWAALLRATEWVANSWRDWRFGGVRIINHGGYVGAAATAGLWLVGVLLGDQLAGAVVIVGVCGLLGAGVWAQALESSSGLSRPFGYFGGIFGGTLGVLAVQLGSGRGWVLFGAFAVAAPLIQGLGRLRCLVQGCCHGRPCPPTAGIRYRHPLSRVGKLAHWADTPVYPTPLYSILGNLVIFGLLLRLWLDGTDPAFVAGSYLILTGCARFMEEAYRGEPQTVRFGGLAIYQWLTVAFVVGGAVCQIWPGSPAPPAALSLRPLLYAAPFGLLVWFAMGVDFPESNRRFSRLA